MSKKRFHSSNNFGLFDECHYFLFFNICQDIFIQNLYKFYINEFK